MSGPYTIPNVLTAVRIALIPAIIVLFYLPYHWSDMACGVMFAIAGITDSFDGYLARKLGQVSPLGAFLDPVADKLIVVSALLALLYLKRVDVIVALIIVGREIAISALREWMAKVGQAASVAVAFIGKLKTVSQNLAIVAILAPHPLSGAVDDALLYAAVVLTVLSGAYYFLMARRRLFARKPPAADVAGDP